MPKPISLTSRLHKEAGLSQPYASQVATGARKPSLKTALVIYRTIGIALGPLQGKSAKDIAAIEKAAAIMGAA